MIGRRILLTGAGFSKNWGGYLASEIWERLLGHPRMQADDQLRLVLLNNPENFETALAAARGLGSEPARAMEQALQDIFEEQDRFENGDWYSFDGAAFGAFIDRFRAADWTSLLFTLNQDALLERKYRPIGGLLAPGVGNVAFKAGADPLMAEHWREVDLGSPAVVVPGAANYFKLHGSFTWRSARGESLVVAGTDKDDQIRRDFPLLGKYLQTFQDACRTESTWLVVVGYSFGDPHINDAIRGGIENGLRLSILDTQPPTVLKRRLQDGDLWPAVAAYSTLPLSQVFRGGHPLAEKIISSAMGAQ